MLLRAVYGPIGDVDVYLKGRMASLRIFESIYVINDSSTRRDEGYVGSLLCVQWSESALLSARTPSQTGRLEVCTWAWNTI